jgi:hypothetical protein
MAQTSQFCSNCGNEKIRLIHVDDNCHYYYLGNYICKACCEMCDWDGICTLNLLWKSDPLAKRAAGER